MAKIPERDWAVGLHVPVDRPGVSANEDGYSLRVSRVGWPASGLVAKIRMVLVFPDKEFVVCSADLEGGGTGKDGQPLAFSEISGTWPGEWQNGVRQEKRPDTLKMEFEVFQPCRSEIDFGAIRENTQAQRGRVNP